MPLDSKLPTAGREKKSLAAVVAKERTGMFIAPVFNIVEVQQIETPSYDTGERASRSPLKLIVRALHSMTSILWDVSIASCPSPEPTEVEANFSNGSDESEVVTSIGSDIINIEDPSGLQGMEPQNPLKIVILTAVLKALKVMDESGSSIKTFEEIVNYSRGKQCCSL